MNQKTNINETARIHEQALKHLFRNNSDCYTQTDNGNGELIEEQVMTENKFVEMLTKASDPSNKNNLLGIVDINGLLPMANNCTCWRYMGLDKDQYE